MQHLEQLRKCVTPAHFNEIFLQYFWCIKYLFLFKNISESWNCNVAMKYFSIFYKNVATIFQLQWNIENIPDIFLQYSVLCGLIRLFFSPCNLITFFFKLKNNLFNCVQWLINKKCEWPSATCSWNLPLHFSLCMNLSLNDFSLNDYIPRTRHAMSVKYWGKMAVMGK